MASITRRRGSELWTAFFRDENGRQHCRSTETADRKLAQHIADHYEAAAQTKRTLRQFQRVLAEFHERVSGESVNSLTVRAFTSEWLKLRQPEIATRTWDFYDGSVQKFLSFLGPKADEPLSGVTKRDLISYRTELAKSLSPHTTNHHLTFVKMLFKAARRDELIHDDPSQFVENLRRSHSQSARRGFTLPEINAVLSVADFEWRSMVLFGLYTGQRLGDLASLTWSNVGLERNEIRFVTAKTARSMVLPMAPALAKHVLSLPTSDKQEAPLHPRAYAILKRDGRSGSLSNQFGDLLAQAGLVEKKTHAKTHDGRSGRRASSSLSFHSLRHSATSFLHDAGIPATTAQAFIGHDSDSIHELYTHVGEEALQKAAGALPELF